MSPKPSSRTSLQSSLQSPGGLASWSYLLIAAVSLLILIALTFAPLFKARFLNYDDAEVVWRNRDMLPHAHSDLSHYWTEPYLQMYTPVAYVGLHLVAGMAGLPNGNELDPAFFHAANIALHVASTLWVWAILLKLMRAEQANSESGGRLRFNRDLVCAAAGAALFAVHPLQTEAIGWVSSFNTLAAGMLSLWSLWHYLAHLQLIRSDEGTAGHLSLLPVPSRAGWGHWIAGLFLFVIAMLCKPSAVVVPAVAAVLAILLLKRPWRRVALSLLPWLLATIPILIVARIVQPPAATEPPAWYLKPLIASDALAFYCWKFIAPVNLLPDYGRTPSAVIQSGVLRYTWIAPALLLAAAIVFRRRSRLPLAAMLLIVAALLPVLGFTSFHYQVFSTVADRYFYFAMLGPAIVWALTARVLWVRFQSSSVAICSTAGILLLCLSVLTHTQASRWLDDQTLFHYTLAHNPRSLAATKTLGFLELTHGNPASAIPYLEIALRVDPNDPRTELTLGNALVALDRLDEARAHLLHALDRTPNNPMVLSSLGVAYAKQGSTENAMGCFARALDLEPENADVNANIAVLLFNNGQPERAAGYAKRALQINPQHRMANAVMQEIGR